jgi:parvulin-like peptidyl-prolyl isomerase
MGPAGTAEETTKKALDRLIFRELAWQKASAGGIAVDRGNIDAAISNLKENMGGDQAYREYLTKESVTEPMLRSQVERSLAIELIYAKEVLGKITIPEADLKSEYDREKQRYILPEKAAVIDIVCLPGKDGKKARTSARSILRKLKEDPDRNPWNLILDGSFIVRKIDGCNGRHAEICAAARKLEVNGLSGIISAADGRHIVKLLSYAPQRQLTFEETKATLEGKFKVAAQDRRMQEWEAELRKDAAIEIIESALVVQKPQEQKELSSAQ